MSAIAVAQKLANRITNHCYTRNTRSMNISRLATNVIKLQDSNLIIFNRKIDFYVPTASTKRVNDNHRYWDAIENTFITNNSKKK